MALPAGASAIVEGLFALGADGAHLIGSRCAECRALYFPKALSCRNPDCRDKGVEHLSLPRRGTLVSYTIQRYRPPDLFRMDDWTPYAIGLVGLGDGLEVMGMLSGVSLDDVTIGSSFEVVLEPLFVDPDRGPILTYKFAPARTGRGS